MTPDLLQECLNCPLQTAEIWAPPLTSAMEEYQINSPSRQAAFLAQIGHESGLFKWVREIWGPTSAQLRYEGRHDLGNDAPGDGFKYRGRGLIQVTGRNNYMKAAASLGIDCLNHPELLEQPINAARSAGDFWKSRGLNDLADLGLFEQITKRINGGLNGYTERCILWDRAKRTLGVN